MTQPSKSTKWVTTDMIVYLVELNKILFLSRINNLNLRHIL